MQKKFVVQIHGGAWDIPQNLIEPHRRGVHAARHAALASLEKNSKPLDAIVAALKVMENDPTFDAGHGSFLNENGEVELDAGIMEGTNLRTGAVACIGSFANPSEIARAVMERTEHVLLVANGAEKFALENGFTKVEAHSLIHPREIEAFNAWVKAGKPDARVFFAKPENHSTTGATPDKRGTVGVVIGVCHNISNKEDFYELFAGTSTGGTPGKRLGRVGDVPLVGCGFYADNEGAAVSCTGWGEGLARVVAAKSVSDLCRGGIHPQNAVEHVLQHMLKRTGGRGGLIAVDKNGHTGTAYTTPEMAFAGEGMAISLT